MRVLGWVAFVIFGVPALLMMLADVVVTPKIATTAPAPAVAPQASYADRVASLLGVVRSMQAADYTQSMDMIGLALGAFRAAAQAIDDGRDLELDDAVAAEREELRRELGRRQAAILPELRDALGPILRKEMWADNGSARTIGAGFRTVEFVAPTFASNRNIAAVQLEMHALLLELRFTRAQYLWFEGAEEMQFYRMDPPADDAVVIWLEDGRWRKVG